MNKVFAIVVLSSVPAMLSAQVVTPVPAKTVPAPAWTPPPVPAPLPPPPPEPDVPAPNIVVRDADGWVVWPSKPFEQVVIEAVPMDEGQKRSWIEKWNARAAQQDEAIVKNLDQAFQLHAAIQGLDTVNELGQLISLAEPMKPLVQQPGIEQFVKTTQIFRAKQQTAFAEGVKHFRAQTLADLNKRVGDDRNKLIIVKSRESIRDRSSEAMAAFERMAGELASSWAKVKDTLGLSGDFAEGEALAAKATDAKGRAAAGIALLKAVPADRRAEVLGTFRTPMPPPPKPPVDPAVKGAELPAVPAQKK